MRQTLYRFFDIQNNLLYVGISSNWQSRLKQHYKHSQFHEIAANITLVHYDTRAEVEAAELVAIRTENPLYNKAFNSNWETPPMHVMKIRDWVYGKSSSDEEHAYLVAELVDIYTQDNLWLKKTAGPIAYYLLEILPDRMMRYSMTCAYCIDAYNSKQIMSWAFEVKGKHHANN